MCLSLSFALQSLHGHAHIQTDHLGDLQQRIDAGDHSPAKQLVDIRMLSIESAGDFGLADSISFHYHDDRF